MAYSFKRIKNKIEKKDLSVPLYFDELNKYYGIVNENLSKYSEVRVVFGYNPQ